MSETLRAGENLSREEQLEQASAIAKNVAGKIIRKAQGALPETMDPRSVVDTETKVIKLDNEGSQIDKSIVAKTDPMPYLDDFLSDKTGKVKINPDGKKYRIGTKFKSSDILRFEGQDDLSGERTHSDYSESELSVKSRFGKKKTIATNNLESQKSGLRAEETLTHGNTSVKREVGIDSIGKIEVTQTTTRPDEVPVIRKWVSDPSAIRRGHRRTSINAQKIAEAVVDRGVDTAAQHGSATSPAYLRGSELVKRRADRARQIEAAKKESERLKRSGVEMEKHSDDSGW